MPKTSVRLQTLAWWVLILSGVGVSLAAILVEPAMGQITETQSSPVDDASSTEESSLVAVVAFFGAVVGALASFLGKYFFEYNVERRRLALEERAHLSERLGSTPADFVRASHDLYGRLMSFFQNPVKSGTWLKPAASPNEDGYYLREFVWRLFAFAAAGRLAQNSLNSLPPESAAEQRDLLRMYSFSNLANAVLTHTWLFSGVEEYVDTEDRFHLFVGVLDEFAEIGTVLAAHQGGVLLRADFRDAYSDERYSASMGAVRSFVARVPGEDKRAAAFVVARLAALKAVLARFLEDRDWVIEVPDEFEIVASLRADLHAADELNPSEDAFSALVPTNLRSLAKRYGVSLFTA